MAVPYTEQRHPASLQIDSTSPEEIAELMFKEDEIFTGWDDSGGILNESVLHTVVELQERVSMLLKESHNNGIVISGCGTSGRLAFMTVRTMNSWLKGIGKRPCFEYLMAGNDIALFTSQEGYEDNPIVGADDLEKVSAGYAHILFIGITCGLSAPYVAGQLDHCMKHPDRFTPVLIGFNPVDMARNVQIENWNKTFRDVTTEMEQKVKTGGAYILNPIIGPELITGSSRMKAGSATKVLLDLIFKTRMSCENSTISDTRLWTNQILNVYREALSALHTSSSHRQIGKVIEMGGNSLQNGGHIYYLGGGNLGLVGMIDASECPPTYGASQEDVRGFIKDGFESLQNKDGDLSAQFPIDTQYFIETTLPQTTSSDLIVILTNDGDDSLVSSLKGSKSQVVILDIRTTDNKVSDDIVKDSIYVPVDLTSCMHLKGHNLFKTAIVEITAKWFCNTLSTGAHVMIGKVYQNLMVDVNVSNNKLYHRAAGIVKVLVGCDIDAAYRLLLRSIYRSDNIDTEFNQPVSKHLGVSTTMSKIVPLALVLGLTPSSVEGASEYLRKYPVLCRAIGEIRKGADTGIS